MNDPSAIFFRAGMPLDAEPSDLDVRTLNMVRVSQGDEGVHYEQRELLRMTPEHEPYLEGIALSYNALLSKSTPERIEQAAVKWASQAGDVPDW